MTFDSITYSSAEGWQRSFQNPGRQSFSLDKPTLHPKPALMAAPTNFASLKLDCYACCLCCVMRLRRESHVYILSFQNWVNCPEYSVMCKINLVPNHLNSGEFTIIGSGR